VVFELDVLMPKPVHLPPPGFDELSVEEKIDYLQFLWDRIAATPEPISGPDWHREILGARMSDLEATPEAGENWNVVQKRLRAKLDGNS
jgi:putative addiction module component (TIGR02574 family)